VEMEIIVSSPNKESEEPEEILDTRKVDYQKNREPPQKYEHSGDHHPLEPF